MSKVVRVESSECMWDKLDDNKSEIETGMRTVRRSLTKVREG